MAKSGGVFQRLQIDFHSGVVDPQEFIRGCHHVDAVGLALVANPVHELVDRFIQRCGLQIDAHNKKECPP